LAMSLATPSKIRELQIKLYRKAKDEPEFRFYQLYDKVYREDILPHAYALVRANQGAPGVDGESFEDIETAGLAEWLNGLREELRSKTYQPGYPLGPVRRVMIPKTGGGERPLGIPTIRDRVVQTAAKLILEPIWEAELEPNIYGYRPRKSAQDAIRKVDELLHAGYTDVVDADLSKYFDTIPHSELLQCVARRIVDGQILHLIKMWLKVPPPEGTPGAGGQREKTVDGWEGSGSRYPARGSDQPNARQFVHEPDVEGISADPAGGAVSGANHRLRGRLCATSAKGRGGPNVCNCLIDEGRPLGTGWQEQVPNHLRRLRPKALVVSTEGKGLGRTRSGDWQEEDRKGTTDDVSKA
jgi:Reverse transcriptase (RNA-dependent DNA polymerase)